MAEMKAMQFTDKLDLQLVIRPVPEPRAGEILIQVFAVGVTPTEKLWYTTSHCADGTARYKAIPGHEFSGTVAGLGAGVSGFSLGDAVFGFNDWFTEGATAEFCITKPASLSLKPSFLSDVKAAAVPIGLLAAWQGLHVRAKLQKGERVLIHGGAGAVGLFAVQIAKSQGAYVIATSSKVNVGFVKQLGANKVIDYRERRFEEAGPVDVIFDTVGGETLNRSWGLLRPGGRLVTIAADPESSADQRIKSAFFVVEQDGAQLAALCKLFDSWALKVFVKTELPMKKAERAYSGSIGGGPGKLIIRPNSSVRRNIRSK
jgi:NADPH:quinone reductase-like Zn-dependent oxidoreductase